MEEKVNKPRKKYVYLDRFQNLEDKHEAFVNSISNKVARLENYMMLALLLLSGLGLYVIFDMLVFNK